MKKLAALNFWVFFLAASLLANVCCAFADETGNRKSLEEFKHIISARYIYKDYKKVYWPSLYAKYEYPILSSRTEAEFAKNLNDLVMELKDAHFLVFDEREKRLSGNSRPKIKKNYNLKAIGGIVGNFTEFNSHVSVGSVDKVGYIMIKDWNFPSDSFDDVLPKSLLLDMFADTRGLVIDVRMNGGGQIDSCEKFAGKFASINLLAAYRHSLDSNGSLIKKEYYLRGTGEEYKKPIILLMGNMSASASEHFILQMQVVPRVKTMGDNSQGSTGVPRRYALSNGTRLTVPSVALMDLQNAYIEEYGIMPDERVRFVENNSDNVLVRAFQKLGASVR
ncbi:MAG: hypothetical protein LBT08_11050 [Synergistaceae bacterium]|jgi:hypothetical protein|nr:hypothetical protein [Synergistaceae bacterium]